MAKTAELKALEHDNLVSQQLHEASKYQRKVNRLKARQSSLKDEIAAYQQMLEDAQLDIPKSLKYTWDRAEDKFVEDN